ncbi:MAG: glycine/sarcosine/betaine reductase selenoprotein B family protein [Stellaceae bacterium]
MTETDADLGFAADYDAPIPYLQRIRDYYQGLGYGAPYRWAHYVEVPFQPLAKPLAECRVALITTAAPYQPGNGDQGPGAPYNAAAKFYRVYSGDTAIDHDLRISHVAYDRAHTSAEDSNTWFPLRQLRLQAAADRIGAVTEHFHGAPTNRSQRTTLSQDCPELLERCRADGADAVILVPNCPVCHQTVSLTARYLEVNGIATVVMGCAKDIVEFVGVPRFLFSDFPLGNSAGRPNDPDSQILYARIGAARPRNGAGGAHDSAVAAALERGLVVEARLLKYRSVVGRGGPPAARRVRPAKSDREDGPQRGGGGLIDGPQWVGDAAADRDHLNESRIHLES